MLKTYAFDVARHVTVEGDEGGRPRRSGPASTELTQVFFGSPGTLPATFVHVLPPSRVTWTLPSSVPTQMTLRFFGDSEMTKMVQWFSAVESSSVNPPDSCCFCFSGSLVVRSGEIRSHDSPLSRERNRNCAP